MAAKQVIKWAIVAACISVGQLDLGCTTYNPCGPGSEPCGNGCMPAGNTCCAATDSNCPAGYTCGPGDTCLAGYVPDGCLANGEETCYNLDGTTDCAPLGAACCGNHHFCAAGTVCNSTGTGCIQ